MGLFQNTAEFLSGVTNRIASAIPEPSVPLTPRVGGGFCIPPESLQPADIIVSTGKAAISRAIRWGTGSHVSHAALFVGDGIIEADGNGVSKRATDVALADDVLAVAYRHPGMNAGIAKKIIAWASARVAEKAKYSAGAATISALPTFACRLNGTDNTSFFCSQLVYEAYRQGGLPLSTLPASCVTPEMIVEISIQAMVYGGHLKGNPNWAATLLP